ncbi:hypothetical protein B0H16DRAFT_1599817 [Mycena metata]|uniref:Diaminopimelate epimerase-like protein n=1 Tax=Mycena metata TaxID=1033252 RepID=A0AAD7MLK5_9AGAR|nr:hypothetical protein B0H16DRAFT_1599817 [Mycena metata]
MASFADICKKTVIPGIGHLEFEILNAFTTNTFGGNPAAIVFSPNTLPNEILQQINDNFNKPIVVYVSPPKTLVPPKPGTAVFALRWFGPRNEMKICGHGTLAAAESIFRRLDPSKEISTLEFETLSGLLSAQRVGDKIQMELPAGSTLPASVEESSLVDDVFARAVGRPSVGIRYMGYGGPGFTNYLLVEVDKSEKLGEWRPKVQHFAELAPRTQILVVTSASDTQGIAYETRMFAPSIGVGEDHVCGSAHCLNAPYWAAKAQDGGYTEGKAQHAKAVSIRGGEIWAEYFASSSRVKIRGNVKPVAVGTLDLSDIY